MATKITNQSLAFGFIFICIETYLIAFSDDAHNLLLRHPDQYAAHLALWLNRFVFVSQQIVTFSDP